MMNRKQIIAISYGWVTTLLLLLFSSALLAVLIRYMFVTMENIFAISLIIGLIILFISGLITGLKGKENGLLLGGIVGLGFIGMTFFIQYVGLNISFTLTQTIYQLTYVLAAIIGSVLGVNLTKR